MPYEPAKFRDASKRVVLGRQMAVGLFVAIFGVKFMYDELDKALRPGLDAFAAGHFLLLIAVIALIFGWFWNTDKELNLLLDWLDPIDYAIPAGDQEIFIMLGTGFLMVALVASAHDPLWFSVVFTVYSVLLLGATWYMNLQIEKAITLSRQRLVPDPAAAGLDERARHFIAALDVLQAYFLKRPIMKRLTVIVVCCVVGLGLGLRWASSGERFIGGMTYIFFAVLIAVSEFVISKWRGERDRTIAELDWKLRELARR